MHVMSQMRNLPEDPSHDIPKIETEISWSAGSATARNTSWLVAHRTMAKEKVIPAQHPQAPQDGRFLTPLLDALRRKEVAAPVGNKPKVQPLNAIEQKARKKSSHHGTMKSLSLHERRFLSS